MTVSEVVDNSSTYLNKDIQVLGTVANGSVTYKNTSIVFNLTDEETIIKVNYTGNPPQNFQEGTQIVVIGELVSPNTLKAAEMLVKCPSKYEGGEKSLLTDPLFLTAVLLGFAAIIYIVVSIALKKEKPKSLSDRIG